MYIENQVHFVRSAEDCQSRMMVERGIRHRPLLSVASPATLTGVRVEGKAPLGSDLSAIADLEAGGGGSRRSLPLTPALSPMR